MEALEIMVADVFNNKESYKEGDYIVIMNILKEAYHVLKGDYGYMKIMIILMIMLMPKKIPIQGII